MQAVPGRHLVEIESQEENDLLSELLYQNSRVTNLMNEVWTGGVGSNIARNSAVGHQLAFNKVNLTAFINHCIKL